MTRRLYRSERNKVIGGVAGGIAEYFDIDPIIPRILFVVTFFAGGSSILVYILMMIIVPKQKIEYFFNEEANQWQERNVPPSFEVETKPAKENGKTIFGIILIGLGTIMFLDDFIPEFDFGVFAALVMISLGGYMIYRNYNKNIAGAGL